MLKLFVFLIIFVLLFSVVGIVVVYLRGIEDQQYNQQVPVTTTPNDGSAIQVLPINADDDDGVIQLSGGSVTINPAISTGSGE